MSYFLLLFVVDTLIKISCKHSLTCPFFPAVSGPRGFEASLETERPFRRLVEILFEQHWSGETRRMAPVMWVEFYWGSTAAASSCHTYARGVDWILLRWVAGTTTVTKVGIPDSYGFFWMSWISYGYFVFWSVWPFDPCAGCSTSSRCVTRSSFIMCSRFIRTFVLSRSLKLLYLLWTL